MKPTSKSALMLPLKGALDLDVTLSMGQTFFWRPVGDSHAAVLDGTLVRVRIHEGSLHVDGDAAPDHLRGLVTHHFDTERDLPTLQRELSADAHVAEAIRRYSGLRVLRQPFWECLAGFILSTVNNVGRITKIVRTLSERLGVRERLGGLEAFSFPGPKRLFDLPLETLYDCGSGFRAKALQGAARAVASGALSANELRAMPLSEARARLTELHGVGNKVADCVLLYALDHLDAFPLDVWMCREIQRLYFAGRPVPRRSIEAFVEGHFGPMAGYSQLYLYHHARRRGAGDG